METKFVLRQIKPWPNGFESGRKSLTCPYLRLRLARICVNLRLLVMTFVHFGRDQTLHASRRKFFTV